MVKPCSFCGNKIAKYTCVNCGASVCEDHYDFKTGLCTNCPIKN